MLYATGKISAIPHGAASIRWIIIVKIPMPMPQAEDSLKARAYRNVATTRGQTLAISTRSAVGLEDKRRWALLRLAEELMIFWWPICLPARWASALFTATNGGRRRPRHIHNTTHHRKQEYRWKKLHAKSIEVLWLVTFTRWPCRWHILPCQSSHESMP